MRLFMIGLPGCGKTTIAKILANKLNLKFIDMDVAIEAREGITINEIFKEKGESYFREVESKVLDELNKVEDVVIACGGGIVLNNTKDHFKGKVIYLIIEPEVLEKRLENDSTRPLLKQNSIYQLAVNRNNLYKSVADLTVYNDDIDKTINLICEALGYEDTNNQWT